MANTQDQLNKNLIKLQETGGVVMADLRAAHKQYDND